VASPLTVTQAAERLGITSARVRFYIANGRLPATRLGSIYVIDPGDLAKLNRGKAGRPPAEPKPAKRGAAGATPAAREGQADVAMRKTLRKAGLPLEPKARKRK
jgi:excisionase family DNA binding protein